MGRKRKDHKVPWLQTQFLPVLLGVQGGHIGLLRLYAEIPRVRGVAVNGRTGALPEAGLTFLEVNRADKPEAAGVIPETVAHPAAAREEINYRPVPIVWRPHRSSRCSLCYL